MVATQPSDSLVENKWFRNLILGFSPGQIGWIEQPKLVKVTVAMFRTKASETQFWDEKIFTFEKDYLESF